MMSMNVVGASTASDSTLIRQKTDLLLKKTSLEKPAVPFAGESRYLPQLWVYGNREPWEELHPPDPSLSRINGLEPRAENFVPHYHGIKEKIRAAYKLLTFREEHVLIQFWSPLVVGKHRLVTTGDQPFGVGAIDEKLILYRRDSVLNSFLVGKDNEEEDWGPPARVYRRGLPEWTYDITNYMPKDFPLQEHAIRCKLLGYLALPVFDSTTRLCVGVLEVLMSSKYVDYAYEVKQIHTALKMGNLITPQVFDYPTSNVVSEARENRMEKILHVLKDVCEYHGVPLAQMWGVSPLSSYVAHEKVLEKSCSSFSTRCIGKVCISTAALPFYVRDLGMWDFRESCRKQHLEKHRGFVGRAFRSHGCCLCVGLSDLSEEEYPLVHHARMISGITTCCFTTFLGGVNSDGADDEYVLEFFLPLHIQGDRYLPNLVKTLRKNIEATSGFKLGDVSSIEGLKGYSFDIEDQSIRITEADTTLTAGSDSEETAAAAAVPIQCPSKQNNPDKEEGSTITLARDDDDDDVIIKVNAAARKNNDNAAMQKTDGGIKKGVKQGRKRKIDSLTLEAVHQLLRKPIGQAAESLGVSRSTLKRFCREHNIPSWPVTNHRIKTAIGGNDPDLFKGLQLKQDLKWSLSVHLGVYVAVLLVIKLKRWSCLRKRHGFSARWWNCGKHRCISSSESRFGIYQAVQLMVSLRRWRKNSIRHETLRFRDYHSGRLNTGGKLHDTQNVLTPNLNDDWQLPYSNFLHVSPHPSSSTILDTGTLTVKATFKGDMIKFPFHLSSGLLELENHVAQRIKLQGRRLLLKYRDEDDDLVLIACDDDLRNLLGFLGANTTLKLHVDLDDN